MGTLYFGKQWLTKGNTCCTDESASPVPASGFKLVSTGGGGGGLLTFGKSVGRGGSSECLCGTVSVPFTFTVHFTPDGLAPNAGGCCLLYENYFQDEVLIIRYELNFCSETDDLGYFTFSVGDSVDGPTETIIRTNSGYHLLGGSLQITCTYTAPAMDAGSDRSVYMAIYINGLRADTSIVSNDGQPYASSQWPVPGSMKVYNNCMYDPEEPDNMQLGIVYEWNRGFTPQESQELFNLSINKQPNPSMWGAFFQESITLPDVDICLRTGPVTEFTTESEEEWIAPPGVYWIYAECQGGGSSGDGGAGSGGTGGGGGGYGAGLVPVIPGNSYTVIVGGVGMSCSFNSTIIGGSGGVPDGGGGQGDVVIFGSDGIIPGADFGGDGGAGATGGAGGAGGTADPDPTSPGSPGTFPGGGGGGGGTDGEVGQEGGAGTLGFVRLTVVYNAFGINNDTHQTHTTGQTNYSILHCQPLNTTTTTQGIGMRRKWILAAAALEGPPTIPDINICLRTGPVEDFIESGDWVAPAGVYWVYAQCQGGGDIGDGGTFGGPGGTGGGGGGYGGGLVQVIPGNTYGVSVGGPGDGSSFSGAYVSVVGAGGDGILGGGGTGDVVIFGGDGIAGIGNDGGQGGSGATGGAGGIGGDGNPNPLTDGSPGSFPGGGGGGAGVDGESASNPGIGAAGFVRLTVVHGVFGYNNNIHQVHAAGQTNNSILHCQPLNTTTTTKGIGMRRKWILAAAAEGTPNVPAIPFCGRQEQALFLSDTTWVVPTGVTSIYVECIGGGGGGGDGDSGADEDGGGGGGGGAYAASTISVFSGQSFAIVVGQAGTGDGSDGTASDFDSGTVVADYGVGAISSTLGTGGLAANSTGTFTLSGDDGIAGVTGSVPPVSGSNGGNAAGGGSGGTGGVAGSAGGVGGYAGGGGGGGGSTFGENGGANGANGLVRISWENPYGIRIRFTYRRPNAFHQLHDTGQTSFNLQHCQPQNGTTTTKGISMRNKSFIAAAGLATLEIFRTADDSITVSESVTETQVLFRTTEDNPTFSEEAEASSANLRITQEYAEVFNVDPPTPNIRTTQFYYEVLDAPPGRIRFAAARFRRLTFMAAGLEPEPAPIPFTAQRYLRMTIIGAALIAGIEPPPAPEGCQVCTGRYRVRVRGRVINSTFVRESNELIGTGPAMCNCDGVSYPAIPH